MKRFAWLATALLFGLTTGCVERRMIVSSDPPAAVFVNNQPYGTGPVDVPFIYYGTYHFTFVRDNFETLVVDQKIPPPWYEWLGIDFFSENVYPLKLRDVRCFNYPMQPLQLIPPADILYRGKELKAKAETITPFDGDGKPLPPSEGLPAGSSSPP
jgi:hypothetical protein